MFVDLQSLHTTQVITAIGALGTSAFGVVQAFKPVCPFINRIGFSGIGKTVSKLTPPGQGAASPINALPQKEVLNSLEANWVNGTDLASQKAIAKSLVKLHMNADNAAALAAATNVDATLLTAAAVSMSTGVALTQAQTDANSRFDLIVTALLDECYQRADQHYRNWTRGLAAVVAVVLALVGGWMIGGEPFWTYLFSKSGGIAVIVGLLATPLAPIAKDLSTALTVAVNTMQMVKKP
jgi:hypothetical protein